MSLFRLFLVGMSEPMLVELPADDVFQLYELAGRGRFLVGRTSGNDGDEGCAVLIPVNRVHLIVQD